MTWTYANFDGFHPSRSSNILLQPTEWIIQKVKEDRSSFHQFQEFFSLHVWKGLTEHYNKEHAWVLLLSPTPIARVTENKSLFMSLVPGEDLSRLSDIEMKEEDFFFEIGRKVWYLLEMKKIEWLQHGDFQPRHLIDVRGNTLGIIDVEGSKYENAQTTWGTVEENKKFIKKILLLPGFSKKEWVFLDGIDQWKRIIKSPESVIQEVIWSVYNELGKWSSKFRTQKKP